MPREDDHIIKAIKKAAPAVVSIISSKMLGQEPAPMLPFGLNGVALRAPRVSRSLPEAPEGLPITDILPPDVLPPGPPAEVNISGGSGFFVSRDGLILTNRHVVQDTEAKYTALTNDDRRLEATVVGRDPINDVAMLKVDIANAPALALGNSLGLELGQTVMTIGNALGMFQNTVSRGVVSGLWRAIAASSEVSGETSQLRGLIQTDAAINPGNSGGPLVDLQGNAVGINTAVVFGAENIGFAIPINAAKRDLETLQTYGEIIHPTIGVRYISINNALQEKFRLPVDYGAWVVREQNPWDAAVIPGSPAHQAGIKENDIITKFNGKKLTEKYSLIDCMEQSKIGQRVKLRVLSDGRERTIEVVLAKRS